MDPQFEVNLIIVNKEQTENAKKSIKRNCTHIDNDVYVMEGDIDCLADDGVDFNFTNIGIVGCLDGYSKRELAKICRESFDVDIYKLNYDHNRKYIEKEKNYKKMPCACCGENMFNRWIRDVNARICHECENRHKILKKDLKFLKIIK